MKKLYPFLVLLLLAACARANDGTFTVDGNQLIPMDETDISVKKEILTINRSLKDPQQAEITVYYEFYNPNEPKTVIVGFEAKSPEGDATLSPVNGGQPYIHHFTVEMNGEHLPYQVAIVSDKFYYQNGKFKTLTSKQIEKDLDESDDEVNFRYVYHFRANFKTGLNIIKHTYTVDFLTSVITRYALRYLLSPAMRWGNKQIDDFTLNINMGNEQRIVIPKTFFNQNDEWTIVGKGKKMNLNTKHLYFIDGDESQSCTGFYIKNGYLVFQKQNFKPKGELTFEAPSDWEERFDTIFNYREQSIISPYEIISYGYDGKKAADKLSKKILRNLPFAMHGYIFSTLELQQYFEQQRWYSPDSTYKPDMAKLSEDEQKWIEYWGK